MSRVGASAILALTTHARDVTTDERERFAARLRGELSGTSLILETCHRVEAYVVEPDDPKRLAGAVMLPAGGRALTGELAVRHAIDVALGRDSVVVGEDQILHQLRESLDGARGVVRLDTTIERLFTVALQAGRRARSWRHGPQRSLADVALSSIERQTGSLRGREVLVVGAGRMGRLVARAAASAGASVWVANRTAEGARSLAAAMGSRFEAFDPGARVGEFAAVVVALGGPWPIGAGTVEALAKGTTIVVDMSVPVALPGAAAEALGTRFVSADDLALAETEPGDLADRSLARSDALAESATRQFLDWLDGRAGHAAAEALVKRADREREAELAALWRRLPDLEPETRAAIEGMTRHLAKRLLREPLERLGRDPDGRTERVVREIFAL